MSYIAPAGTPVSLSDVARGITVSKRDSMDSLVAELRQVSGLPFAHPMSSGRAAMTLILRAMRTITKEAARDEVIIPAYTCYSVPAAIELAGLKTRLCDIDPATCGMDPARLSRCDFSRTLAVISSNLYGLPNDLDAIESISRSHGVFMLDDAAQALGARLGNRAVGSFGDAGLYSFDKGKIISTIQGGAVVSRPGPLQEMLALSLGRLESAGMVDATANLLKLIVYAVFLRPSLYGIIQRLPFTGLGHTAYDPEYPIARLAGFQVGLAATLMRRLSHLNSARRSKARDLVQVLRESDGVVTIDEAANAQPVYARFPLRVPNRAHRERLIAAMNRAGIGATSSYPYSLADVPQVAERLTAHDRSCPGARELAATIVTLPTHAYCPTDYIDRIRSVLRACKA